MSIHTDTTTFASHFDFDSEQVRIADLVEHLRVMGMHPEIAGEANALAVLAAAELLEAKYHRTAAYTTPGTLIQVLRILDSDTWGETL